MAQRVIYHSQQPGIEPGDTDRQKWEKINAMFAEIYGGGAGGGGQGSEYESYITNGQYNFNDQIVGAATQISCDNYHYVRDDVNGTIRIGITNSFLSPTALIEVNGGSNLTASFSIINSNNTLQRFLFSGNTQVVIASGATVYSDPLTVQLKKNERIRFRSYGACPNGVVFGSRSGNSPQCFSRYGTSGVVDSTDNTTAIPSGSYGGVYFGPNVILGTTRKPTFGVIGDSRAAETYVGTSGADITYDAGYAGRGLGPKYGVFTYATPSWRTDASDASRVKGIAFLAFASHVLIQLGYNDLLTDGSTAALVTAYTRLIAQIRAVNPTCKIYIMTIAPGSSGDFTSVAGQTTNAINASRVAINTLIRLGLRVANVPTIDGYIEIADHCETARGSGIWHPNMAVDGIHENGYGLKHIVARANLTDYPWDRPAQLAA